MEKPDFVRQIERLKSAYGENQWPQERIAGFWRKFKDLPLHGFSASVTEIILRMPPAKDVYALLQDAFPSGSALVGGVARMEAEHPVQPNAAELAKKYAPALNAAVRAIGQLPYDPKSSCYEEESEYE